MGGISEVVKAIADAEQRGTRVVLHAPYSGPALIAAQQADMLCEHRYGDLVAKPLGEATEARDGFLRVPDGPGLGVEVDVAAIKRYRGG
jgi:L-alanine-DL-glutamate epimerase-like enolase superfamily enzyme